MNHVDIKVITLSNSQCWTRSGYPASMSAILEAKNYVKKLLFSIGFLNRNVFERSWTTDSNKCHDVQSGAIIGDGDRKSWDPHGPMIWDNFSILEQIALSWRHIRANPLTCRGFSCVCCHGEWSKNIMVRVASFHSEGWGNKAGKNNQCSSMHFYVPS